MYNHIKEIVADSEKTGKPISKLIIEQECKMSGQPREKIWNKMKYNLQTMRDAVKKVPEVKNVDVEFVWYPVWTPDRMSDAAKEYFNIDTKKD